MLLALDLNVIGWAEREGRYPHWTSASGFIFTLHLYSGLNTSYIRTIELRA